MEIKIGQTTSFEDYGAKISLGSVGNTQIKIYDMDLDACLKILAQRGQTTNNSSNPSEIAKACPCCAELVTKEPKSYDNGISDHNNDNDALGKLPTLELVQLFTTLQGERVSVSIFWL